MVQGEKGASGRVEELLDRFAYVLLGAPDFPEEDRTNLETEFTCLIDGLSALRNQVQDVERRRWLEMAITDVRESHALLERGEVTAGKRQLQAAEQHLKNWTTRQAPRPTFLVGPDGSTKKV